MNAGIEEQLKSKSGGVSPKGDKGDKGKKNWLFRRTSGNGKDDKASNGNGDEEVEARVEEKGKELGNDRSSRTMHEDRGSCPRADARWERDGVRRERGHTPHWTER